MTGPAVERRSAFRYGAVLFIGSPAMSFSRLRVARNLLPLPPRPDRLELDLVGEDLPEHLPRLDVAYRAALIRL